MRTSINNDETGMVDITVHALQYGFDAAHLREECKAMERACRLQQLRVSTVRGLQRRLLDGWGAKFLFERAAAALTFFPFDSADLVEPGGVVLGANRITDTPVVYDYARRVNSNVTFVGESGRTRCNTNTQHQRAQKPVTHGISFLAQPLGRGHPVPSGSPARTALWVGGPAGEALDVNRASLVVLRSQALDAPLRHIEFLGYHIGTPALLQLSDGVPYGPVRQLWPRSSA